MPKGALVQQPWMPHAWADLGQREIAGSASNPRIVEYIRRSGHPEAANDATAWCAAFVGACLDRAGIAGTRSLLARSYLGWGSSADPPALGSIAILSRGDDPASGHVGFVVGMTDERVVLLGGNQSDQVSVESYPLSRVLDFRVPSALAPLALPDFAFSLARILVFEGGWTDDPFDPGGPTNKGITLAVFARAIGTDVTADNRARLKEDLRDVPDSLVERIYRERYWQPAACDQLPPPLAHFHFDTAVNQGVSGASRMLQEALEVEIDGEIGPLTLSAARGGRNDEVLGRYAEIRRRRYRTLRHFWRFGRGWLSRVDQALAQALSLDNRQAGSRMAPPFPTTSPVTPAQTRKDDNPMPAPDQTTMTPTGATPLPDTKWWGNSLTIWGALLTAATTVAPAVFAAFGLDVPVDVVRRLGTDAVAVAQALGGLIGTVMTIVGRARASTPLERRAMAVRF